ncbi:hypothetical protein QQO25_03940 [Corynebacterium lehmanniae]|nr:hypothetical protein [Corynebacterium lehmanniae]
MALQNGSFPHPVAGNGDDVDSNLALTNILVSPSVEDVQFDFRLITDDLQLIKLVESGDLSVVVFWHCRATLSSGILEPTQIRRLVDGWKFSCQLDQNLIRDRVDVTVEIVAPNDIQDFKWEKQHEDYGEGTFAIKRADYLGIVDSFYFDAAKLYDPMTPPLGSIFQLIEDPELKVPMQVDFNGETQVRIRLSSNVATGFRELGYYSSLKLSLIVLPALMETLSFVARMEAAPDGEDLSGKDWYHQLRRLLAYHKADLTLPLEAAQKLLGNPTEDALNIVNDDESEG